MIGFKIREKHYIQESILFGYPGSSDNAIAISYMLKAIFI